jgi:hypothetical protein
MAVNCEAVNSVQCAIRNDRGKWAYDAATMRIFIALSEKKISALKKNTKMCLRIKVATNGLIQP